MNYNFSILCVFCCFSQSEEPWLKTKISVSLNTVQTQQSCDGHNSAQFNSTSCCKHVHFQTLFITFLFAVAWISTCQDTSEMYNPFPFECHASLHTLCRWGSNFSCHSQQQHLWALSQHITAAYCQLNTAEITWKWMADHFNHRYMQWCSCVNANNHNQLVLGIS